MELGSFLVRNSKGKNHKIIKSQVEPKKVSKPIGRRGRRSKKNSEVVAETSNNANDDQESSGQLNIHSLTGKENFTLFFNI